jgi:predicted ribosomally synthesized peptide with nif11-like leader
MSLKHVEAFYNRLAVDDIFNARIQNVQSKEECSQIVKAAGYNFTSEEFETYTAQMLETAEVDSELQSLNEKELAAVYGGAIASLFGKGPIGFPRNPVPMYGVIFPPDEISSI